MKDMFSVRKNIFFKSMAYTMLLSASFHLLASLFTAITTGSPDVANMFNIIGVSLLFPSLATGAFNSFLGALTLLGLGACVYIVLQYHDSQTGKQSK